MEPTNQLINTQPAAIAQQGTPDPNAVSLAQGQPQGQGQQVSPQQRAEQAKAAMGVATMLQKHLLRPKTASSSSQNAPEQEKPPASQEDVKKEVGGSEDRIMKELESLKKELQAQKDGNKELADLKEQIKQILNE